MNDVQFNSCVCERRQFNSIQFNSANVCERHSIQFKRLWTTSIQLNSIQTSVNDVQCNSNICHDVQSTSSASAESDAQFNANHTERQQINSTSVVTFHTELFNVGSDVSYKSFIHQRQQRRFNQYEQWRLSKSDQKWYYQTYWQWGFHVRSMCSSWTDVRATNTISWHRLMMREKKA